MCVIVLLENRLGLLVSFGAHFWRQLSVDVEFVISTRDVASRQTSGHRGGSRLRRVTPLTTRCRIRRTVWASCKCSTSLTSSYSGARCQLPKNMLGSDRFQHSVIMSAWDTFELLNLIIAYQLLYDTCLRCPLDPFLLRFGFGFLGVLLFYQS